MELTQIRNLKDSDKSLYAQNTTRNIITANDESGRFEIGPKGSDNNVLPLPKSKLDLPGVQKLIKNGSLIVGTAEDIESAFDEAEASKKSDQSTLLEATIEADKAGKDLIEKKCLITGKQVFQTVEEVKNLVPPLDDSVKDKASEFIPQQTQNADGEIENTWQRVKIG